MDLSTDRLRLRPMAATDLDAIAGLLADPEVVRFIGDGRPRSRARAGVTVSNAVRMWDERGFGPFVIERSDDRGRGGRFVGACLLFPIARSGIDPTDLGARGPEIEIGYWLAPEFWGAGYATEAARSVLAWAVSDQGPRLERVVGVTLPANEPSKRVLERIGMVLVGETDAYYDTVTTLYETPGRSV
jgi:RimJ/RimL family protein N-acetyltransferase